MGQPLTANVIAAATLAIAGLLIGCSPRDPDPLTWQVEAGSPEKLTAWCDENLKLMPGPLRREFTMAFNNIVAKTPDWQARSSGQVNNPVCLHLDRRSVRDVVIEGLQLTRDEIGLHLDMMEHNDLTLLQALGKGTDREEDLLEKREQQYRSLVDEIRKQRDSVQKRIDELMAAPAKT
ncbi:MAG TPA: hypothetical protein VGM73_14725 [Candidatus Didemnitutus sp.]|jgi:hypothetical protein